MVLYAGFKADSQGLLWIGSRWGLPWRADVRFMSSGVEVLRRGKVAEVLPWDDYRSAGSKGDRTWWIRPRFVNAGPTTIEIGVRPGHDVDATEGKRRWKLSDSALNQLIMSTKHEEGVVLRALCEYLASTPTARPGLDDPSKCARLVEGLRDDRLGGPGRQGEPMYIGRKGELRQAVDQTAQASMRYFGGRPVSGDPLLTVEELADMTLKRLPTWIDAERRDPAKVRILAAQKLAIAPWPFGVLRQH